MSLLSNLQKVASPETMSQVINYYGSLFPMEIRYHLANFLESRLLHLNYTEEHPQFEIDAKIFFKDFINEIESKSAGINDTLQFPTKSRLIDAALNLRNLDPISIYSHLMKCMSFEQQVLANVHHHSANKIHDIIRKVSEDIGNLLLSTRRCKELQQKWITSNECYRLENHEINNEETCGTNSDEQKEINKIIREVRQESLNNLLTATNEDCSKLMTTLQQNTASCRHLTSLVIDDYIRSWKSFQKYYGINAAINGADLDCIQSWCEKIAESLWNTREQIRLTQSYQEQNGDNESGLMKTLTQMCSEVSQTLIVLVNGSFIIEQQPPQAMKTNNKFKASLRSLIGEALGLKFSLPAVSVKIISETQAQNFYHFHKSPKESETPGRIINGMKSLEFTETTRHMTVKFDSLKLVSFKRPNKKSADNVTDEKSALLFEVDMNIGDLKIAMSAMSLPIVVTVHGNQETLALATIFFDNSFSNIERVPFFVPEQITWKNFAEALNQEIIKHNERGLTLDNLNFLAEKFFQTSFPTGVPDKFCVSWSAFCKKPLTNQKFTFWEWFQAACKTIKDHFRGPWAEGSVMGFVSKEQAEECLKNSTSGTFLLRFSDSVLGAISISKVIHQRPAQVEHVQPFNSKDLAIRSLSDRLDDLGELKMVYPNKPKNQAFDRFRPNMGKSQKTKIRHYVPAILKLVLFDEKRKQPSTSSQSLALSFPMDLDIQFVNCQDKILFNL